MRALLRTHLSLLLPTSCLGVRQRYRVQYHTIDTFIFFGYIPKQGPEKQFGHKNKAVINSPGSVVCTVLQRFAQVSSTVDRSLTFLRKVFHNGFEAHTECLR